MCVYVPLFLSMRPEVCCSQLDKVGILKILMLIWPWAPLPDRPR